MINEGQEALYPILKACYDDRKQVPKVIHKKMMDFFRAYIVTGGMPEVLVTYFETRDFTAVLVNQQRIIEDYKSDIAKHADTKDRVRAREVFDSIPFQLGKDNKKFQYKYVSKSGRSSMYEGSIQWLIDAGIIYKCSALTQTTIPLASYKRVDAFKLYVMDIGLLVSMLGSDAQAMIVLDNLGIAKGAIYENVIGIFLKILGYDLYYYERNSGLEIDFVIVRNLNVTAIEVKSSDNTKSKSLGTLMGEKVVDKGIKLSTKNLYGSDSTLRIPLYMAMFL